MLTHVGKLLTSRIDIEDLFSFSESMQGLIAEAMEGNSTIAPYLAANQGALDDIEMVFKHSRVSPCTEKIKRKHAERVALLTAVRRMIGVAQSMLPFPEKVEAANSLKRAMKERGWWIYDNVYYRKATAVIIPFLELMAEEPFARWVIDTGVQPILTELDRVQQDFTALYNERIEEWSSDMTPTQSVVREKAIEVAWEILSAINFGAQTDPETYSEVAASIRELIIETNGITRAAQTRDKNEDGTTQEDLFSIVSSTEIEVEDDESPDPSLEQDEEIGYGGSALLSEG